MAGNSVPVNGGSAVGTGRQRWGFPVAGGILGWVLDAYDFFVLVFLMDQLAQHFHVPKSSIVATIPLTLAMRPVGALVLGWLSDRWGRRIPLLACVVYFSVVTALTPLMPSYHAFLLLRGLYGVGMGGYWGLGAALVMESSPLRWRGLFSGMLQAGYSVGYLLAAVALRLLEPHFGWQSMFYAGLGVALVIAWLVFYSPYPGSVGEPRAQNQGHIWGEMRAHIPSFLMLTLIMSVITCLSHGTQDLYPDFLKSVHGFTSKAVANISIVYNIGATLGAVVIGRLSDRLGRRNCISLALGICFLAIPLWAFGGGVASLYVGAFIMQFGVQGAFGVVPAYLNELSPASARGLFPGLVYQLGVLIGAPCVVVEYALRNAFGYSRALAGFEVAVIAVLLVLIRLSKERHGRDFAHE